MEFFRAFRWTDELSTAVTFLDEEHRDVIQRYHELLDDLQEKRGSSRFLEDMNQLLEDTRAHFLHEEQVMRNIQYPGYWRHRAAHQKLINDFSDFIRNVGVGLSSEDLPALTEYFRYWFLNHVQEYDVKLKQFLDRAE